MEKERSYASGFSAIGITAAISVFAFLSVLGWQIERSVQEKQDATTFIASVDARQAAMAEVNAAGTLLPPASARTASTSELSAASSTDVISYIGPVTMHQLIGSYFNLRDVGTYSPAQGQKIAKELAPSMRADISYPIHTERDAKTDPDISYKRMLTYRADLRAAFAPLLKNRQPEFEIFAYYVQTKDKSYLTKLAGVAEDYRDAARQTENVTVPKDAVSYHVSVLNAMEEFAATLEALAAHADDPFASVALLRTYNQAEADMLGSFNALTGYYKSKQP